jgi:hypothetical protein
MAAFVGFVADAASVIIPLALSAAPPKQPDNALTNVNFYLGSGSNTAGGPCPHVALWDNGEVC